MPKYLAVSISKKEQAAAAWKGNKEITDSLFPSKGRKRRDIYPYIS